MTSPILVTVERRPEARGSYSGRRLSRNQEGGSRGILFPRRLVRSLAQDSEREGEQEDQNRDHDHECYTFAHPSLLSQDPCWHHSILLPARSRLR
jgi:hypothetical protein